jgi:hypothetical protein
MYKDEYTTDVTLQQLSTSNHIIPGQTILLENAYPIQVGAVELANDSDGLMELAITWEYDNFRKINNFDVDVDIKLTFTDEGQLEKLHKNKKFDHMRNEDGPPKKSIPKAQDVFKRQPIAKGL